MMTRLPSLCNASANPRPMPEPPPVMKIVFPVKFIALFLPFLRTFLQSVNLSSRCELPCYFIYLLGMERNMPFDLLNTRERILIRPHRVDGLLSASGNAVISAIAFVRVVGSVIRPFQLGKINVLTWNVLNWRIRRFAERLGVAGIGNHPARDGHVNASGIALDGNRVIRTWKFDVVFFHVCISPFCSCSALQNDGRTQITGLSCRRPRGTTPP